MSSTTDVMTAHSWKSNAHMLADLRRVMPYPTGRWCDLTYGKGAWWRAPNTPPDDLVRCIGPHTDPVDGAIVVDFRATEFADDEFAATFFDPPYVLKGADAQFAAMNRHYGIDAETMRARGAATRDRVIPVPADIAAHPDAAYGVDWLNFIAAVTSVKMPSGWSAAVDQDPYESYLTAEIDGPRGEAWRVDAFANQWKCCTRHKSADSDWDDVDPREDAYYASFAEVVEAICGPLPEPTRRDNLKALIEDGLTEAARITQPGGWIFAKAGRGIDGGKLFATDDLMVQHGHALGLREVVSLWLLSTPRSQKHRGPQRTPRSNISRLTVFEVAG